MRGALCTSFNFKNLLLIKVFTIRDRREEVGPIGPHQSWEQQQTRGQHHARAEDENRSRSRSRSRMADALADMVLEDASLQELRGIANREERKKKAEPPMQGSGYARWGYAFHQSGAIATGGDRAAAGPTGGVTPSVANFARASGRCWRVKL